MTEKQLRRLSRAELLELLLVQTKEVERLQEKLTEAEILLANRQLHISQAGNLAEAVVGINGIIEAAQAAADQYLENIAAMEAATRHRSEQIIHLALVEAQKIREAAETGMEYHMTVAHEAEASPAQEE